MAKLTVTVTKSKRIKTSQIVLNTIFIAYSVVCLAPLLLVLAGSLSTESDIMSYGYGFIPRNFSTVAYRFIFGNGKEVVKALFTSVFTTAVATGVGILVMAALAYPLSRRDFKYKRGFTFYVYMTMLFNGGMVPLYLVYTQLIPIKNSMLALIIPNMIGGFNILLMKNFFSQNIPEEVVESAEIDGASTYRIFFSMVLPLGKPVLATVGLFTAIAYWNDFFRNMLFINDGNINNLQYLLYRITQQIQVLNQNPQLAQSLGGSLPDETARMAMAMIAIVPIALVFPFIQRFFVKGLAIGAVKG